MSEAGSPVNLAIMSASRQDSLSDHLLSNASKTSLKMANCLEEVDLFLSLLGADFFFSDGGWACFCTTLPDLSTCNWTQTLLASTRKELAACLSELFSFLAM